MKITLKRPALDNVQKILCTQSVREFPYLCWRSQHLESGGEKGQLCPYRTSEFLDGSLDRIHFVPIIGKPLLVLKI